MKRITATIIGLIMMFSCMSYTAFAKTEYTINVPKHQEQEQLDTSVTSVPEAVTVKEEGEVSPKEAVKDSIIDEKPAVTDNVTFNNVKINLRMIPRMQVIDSFAKLGLYDENGVLLGEDSQWVGGITQNLTFDFEVPEYKPGKTFVLKVEDGLSYVKYYDDLFRKDEKISLVTYGYKNESGEYVKGNEFHLDACPEYEHVVIVYLEGVMQNYNPKAVLYESCAMVPVRQVANAMGLDVRYDEKYQSVVCELGNLQVIFNIGTNYATFMGKDTFMNQKCIMLNDTVYIPVRAIAEAFGCSVEAIDFEDHIDVCIGESPVLKDYFAQLPINSMNVSSQTDYMVWVDKSDYEVRVYKGSKNKWHPIATFPCAIGAPDTPTITGSFEYQYKASLWDYGTYYVGPCLVFYGGYAIHSTLLYYSGAPYDNRVGVKISHGCVRIRKDNIDWLASILPLKSRIFVTE